MAEDSATLLLADVLARHYAARLLPALSQSLRPVRYSHWLRGEFAVVYNRRDTDIPLRVPSGRPLMPIRWFADRTAKNAAISESAADIHASDRPVLVGTRFIEDSEQLAAAFRTAGLEPQILNRLQTAEETDIVAAAEIRGAVTIITNLAGRGTDIRLSDEVRRRGGLHVVVAERQMAGRMDRQLIGRCARQGNPGTAQLFVSADDILQRRFGDWLQTSLRREADSSGEVHTDFSRQSARVQAAAEHHQFAGRRELLRHDWQRDALFGQQQPAGISG